MTVIIQAPSLIYHLDEKLSHEISPVRNQPSLILQMYPREAGRGVGGKKATKQSNTKSPKQQMVCQEERKQSSFSLLKRLVIYS